MKHSWEVYQEPTGHKTVEGWNVCVPIWRCTRCGGCASIPEWNNRTMPSKKDLKIYKTPEDCDESLVKGILES